MVKRKLLKNILYIADPNSIHDFKWISFFSKKEKVSAFLLYEKQNYPSKNNLELLKKNNVKILKPLNTFSISSPFKTIFSIYSINNLIKKHKIDIVHILFATPHALWANFINTPTIITTRGSDVLIVIPELLSQNGIKKKYNKWIFKKFKSSFKKAKFITCTSTVQKDNIKKNFDVDNVNIIRTGIDFQKVVNSKKKVNLPSELIGKKFIFSPRFFLPIYNIKIQIEAIKLLSQKIIKEYIFVFIKGKKYDELYANDIINELEILKKKIGLNYRIEDFLDQEILWTYFNYASLTIHTPLSDGTPNSALEAMAAKCPIIIPKLNYDKLIFENSCYTLKVNKSIELSKLISKSLKSYPDEFIENAFIKVSKFGNREVEMNRLYNLYDSIN